MILSTFKDPTPKRSGAKKQQSPTPLKVGERTKASDFFQSLPLATRTAFLSSTVEITKQSGRGSGVILFADNSHAYVLTATHILYLFGGDLKPKKTPMEYAQGGAMKNAVINYNPPDLLQAPTSSTPQTASVEVDWSHTANSWEQDVMVLKVSDGAFLSFVNTNRFLNQGGVGDYDLQLGKNKPGPMVLNSSDYDYIQLGYGISTDKDITATKDYDPFAGKVQCLQSQLNNRAVIDSAFSVAWGKDKRWTITTLNKVCMLAADNTRSTGEGDSGGPMFAMDKKTHKEIFLIAVNSGGNFFTDEEYKRDPSKAPRNNAMHNNVASYWFDVFQSLEGEIPD